MIEQEGLNGHRRRDKIKAWTHCSLARVITLLRPMYSDNTKLQTRPYHCAKHAAQGSESCARVLQALLALDFDREIVGS